MHEVVSPSIKQRIMRILQEEGFTSLLRKLGRTLSRRPRFTHLYVLRLECKDMKIVASPTEALEHVEVFLSDRAVIASLADFGFYGRSPQEVIQYLASGQRCFVAKRQGQVAACYWMACGQFYDFYLKRDFALSENEQYLMGAYTLPEFRGKNVLRDLFMKFSHEHFRKSTDWSALIIVRRNNRASLRLVQKVGFTIVGRVGFIECLGIRFQFLFGKKAFPTTASRNFLQIF